MLLTYLLTCLLINSIQWRGGVRTTKCLWDDRPTVCILFIRDGVLEDWPRPRGHLEDKILWPWPRPCCPRTHPCAIILCLHSNIRLTSYQLYTSSAQCIISRLQCSTELVCIGDTFEGITEMYTSPKSHLWSLTNHVGLHIPWKLNCSLLHIRHGLTFLLPPAPPIPTLDVRRRL